MVKAVTADELRNNLVPVTSKFKQGEFSEVSVIHGERLVFEADWKSKQIYLTIVKGGGIPMYVHQGLADRFEITYMMPRKSSVDEAIGFTRGEPGATLAKYRKLYQDHILEIALAANQALEGVPDDVLVSDEVKSQVREILEPYRDQYDYT